MEEPDRRFVVEVIYLEVIFCCKDNDFFAIISKEKDKNALFEGIN